MTHLQKTAAEWRKENGNESRISYIKTGRIDGLKSADLKAEIVRQSELSEKRQKSRTTDFKFWLKTLPYVRSKRRGAQLAKLWPFREASMGNWFAVRTTHNPTLTVTSFELWPDQSWAPTGYYGHGDTYSKRSRQSAKHYQFTLGLPYGYNYSVIGNLLTVWEGKMKRTEVKEVTWWEQSRGMDVKSVRGYLYRGYHVKAKSADKAKAKIDKERQKAAAKIIASRQAANYPLEKVWVGIKDAANAGNCMAGIRNFASRAGINPGKIGAVRGDYLLEIANKYGNQSNVQRAIKAAISRKLKLD